jgi:hypothetical protein
VGWAPPPTNPNTTFTSFFKEFAENTTKLLVKLLSANCSEHPGIIR